MTKLEVKINPAIGEGGKDMFDKKLKCGICGSSFEIKKENVYEAYDTVALLKALNETGKTYDAIDCPECGCQKILQVRLPKVDSSEEEK